MSRLTQWGRTIALALGFSLLFNGLLIVAQRLFGWPLEVHYFVGVGVLVIGTLLLQTGGRAKQHLSPRTSAERAPQYRLDDPDDESDETPVDPTQHFREVRRQNETIGLLLTLVGVATLAITAMAS